MALVLDGSAGISGVDGTAANPSLEGTDSNTGVFFPAADTVAIGTGGTEALRVNSSQNVGIGTTSPATKLHVSGQSRFADSSNASNYITIGAGANAPYSNASISTTTAGLAIVAEGAGNITFRNNGSEAMRIDAANNLGLGVTPSAWGSTTRAIELAAGAIESGTSGVFLEVIQNAYFDGTSYIYKNTATALRYTQSLGAHQWFNAPSGTAGNAIAFTERARITSGGDFLIGTTTSQDPLTVTNGATINGGGLDFSTSGTKNWQVIGNATDFYIGNQTLTRYASLVGITTFTAWTFVSDRRLKHEIKDLSYGLNSLMQIKPREFNFIKDNQFSIGFIAQELKEVIPEAVMGDEIEFDDNDSPEERASKTMGVSKEMLIPVLVKAIQEQQALITQLQADVAALKGQA